MSRIMSLANKPLKTPQDMIGKKIGVQATNESVWDAFLAANSIDPSKIDKVPVQFDPTPLTTGTLQARIDIGVDFAEAVLPEFVVSLR